MEKLKGLQVKFLLNLPVELAKKLDQYASTMETIKPGACPSRSAAVRELLEDALDETKERKGDKTNGK